VNSASFPGFALGLFIFLMGLAAYGATDGDYALLGLSRSERLTQTEIESAFRQQARTAHPDNKGESASSSHEFIALRAAYLRILAEYLERSPEPGEVAAVFQNYKEMGQIQVSILDDLFVALKNIHELRDEWGKSLIAIDELSPHSLREIFQARAAKLDWYLKSKKNLTNYLIYLRSLAQPSKDAGSRSGSFLQEAEFYKKLLSPAGQGSGTAPYSNPMDVELRRGGRLRATLAQLIEERLQQNPTDLLYIRIVGLGSTSGEYVSLMKLLDQILKEVVAPGKATESVQKLGLRILLYDKNLEVLKTAQSVIQEIETGYAWAKGTASTHFTDMKIDEAFEAWKPGSTALVISRNSLRFQTWFEAAGFLDSGAKSLIPGGVFVVDLQAGAPMVDLISNFKKDRFSRRQFPRILDSPETIGLVSSDAEALMFMRRKIFLPPPSADCPADLGSLQSSF
jgi:curved DNA-binding protein CbpA